MGACPGSYRNPLHDLPSARSPSHRQKVDRVQPTVLKCRVCAVLKRLPASKVRVHSSFGPVLASKRLTWVPGRRASAEAPPARPAQDGGTAVAILASTQLARVPGTGCFFPTGSEGTELPRAISQPWGGSQAAREALAAHKELQSDHSPRAPINLPGNQTRPAVGPAHRVTGGWAASSSHGPPTPNHV